MRVKFLAKGGQRNFLQKVIYEIDSPSLRGILQFGVDVSYSTLKNYYAESRLMPESLFNELCMLANLDKSKFKFRLLEDNWGRSKGGKTKRRKSFLQGSKT